MTSRTTPEKIYHGVIVPLVTPLTPQGELDEPALHRIIDFLVTGGVDGIFVLGTTGEGPSTPHEIRPRLVRLALEYANERAQVYVGIASTVVDKSLDAAKDYLRQGVTAVVAPLPGYFVLTPGEQFRYFATLAERIRGPLLLYDIPAAVRTPIDWV